MGEKMHERSASEKEIDVIVLSRDGDRQFILSHAGNGRSIPVDEHTASKLMLLESFGETEKSHRLVSKFMGDEVKGFRLDTKLLAELEVEERKGRNHSAQELVADNNLNGREKRILPDGQEEEAGKKVSEGRQGVDKDVRNTVLDAHITGVGAGGDFHLSARVQNEKSGEVRDVKGMITGLDAALLRSDPHEEGKDGTVLRNAQALANENFEKGMSAAFTPNKTVTMKME